jgi:hypothetical protein
VERGARVLFAFSARTVSPLTADIEFDPQMFIEAAESSELAEPMRHGLSGHQSCRAKYTP